MKFAIGEIVIMLGGFANGAEAEVVQLLPELATGKIRDYRVNIPNFPSPHPLGWACMEKSLRKRRPPEVEINWEEKLQLKAPKVKEKIIVR